MFQETLIKPILVIYLKFRHENLPFDFNEIGEKPVKSESRAIPAIGNTQMLGKRVSSDDFKENPTLKITHFSKTLEITGNRRLVELTLTHH